MALTLTLTLTQNPKTPGYASKGSMVDLRPMLNETASRLLFMKHPRQVTEYAKLKSLQNAVNMVPGKAQRQANMMGDCYSKQTSLHILEKICEDYDEPIVAMKDEVESLYMGTMATASQKSRRALARKMGITGYSFYPDNVGRVSSFTNTAHCIRQYYTLHREIIHTTLLYTTHGHYGKLRHYTLHFT